MTRFIYLPLTSLFLVLALPVIAQGTDPQWQTIRLDGQEVFVVRATQENRREQIEQRLQRFANGDLDPAKLQVRYQVDDPDNHAVVSVNGQELLTITPSDAEFGNESLEARAAQIASSVKTALEMAIQERQPQVLIQRGLIAGGVTLLAMLASLGLERWRRQVKVRIEICEAEIAQSTSQLRPSAGVADPVSDLTLAEVQVAQVSTALSQRRQQRLVLDLAYWSLRLTQAGVWTSWFLLSFGLFPYTRAVQVIVLEFARVQGLRLVGIVTLTYLSARAASSVVDSTFDAVREGRLFSQAASPRMILRANTFSRAVKGVLAVIISSVGVLVVLSTFGVNVAPVLAGAGIVGVALSLGSQSLIKDYINGFFILVEDQYGVGDVIAVNGMGGQVENMNLRITQLRDSEGRLITVPNSEIKAVANLSNGWARVDLSIQVAYDSDVDRVLALLKELGQQMWHERPWSKQMLEEPEVLGVDGFGDDSITIRIWIKTWPLQQWSVAREFRRRLKNAFDREGISIPNPGRSLWLHTSLDSQTLDSEPGQADGPAKPQPSDWKA